MTMENDQNPVLEIAHVDYGFRVGFWMKYSKILNGINLKVPLKSIFGFLGANGAGKTTLIHLIAGLRKPLRGTVKIFGQEAHTLMAKKKMGYLPERPYFYGHLTGAEILKHYGTLAGMNRPLLVARIPKVLAQVGMTHAHQIELRNYSKGMLQRIGIAQALIHDPEFLVLDEPMSGLDPLGRKEIRELLLSLAAEGRTLFFSTHLLHDVETICDQVAILHRGKIIGAGSVESYLSQGTLHTEVTFSNFEPKDLASIPEFISIQKIQGGMKGLVVGQEQINLVLLKLLQEKAKILSVLPVRPSLENLLSSL